MTDTSRPKILLAHCDHRGCDFMALDLQLPIQSVHSALQSDFNFTAYFISQLSEHLKTK
jgi:hypothetical protein